MNPGMAKIIDIWARRGNDKIYVSCSCIGGDDHNLVIMRDRECPTEFYVSIQQTDAGSIWARIKYAFRYIWHGPYSDSIVVEEEEIRELGKTLVELEHIVVKPERPEAPECVMVRS